MFGFTLTNVFLSPPPKTSEIVSHNMYVCMQAYKQKHLWLQKNQELVIANLSDSLPSFPFDAKPTIYVKYFNIKCIKGYPQLYKSPLKMKLCI